MRVGDWVRVVRDDESMDGRLKNQVGCVVFVIGERVSVEFVRMPEGHDCGGRAKEHFGYNFEAYALRKLVCEGL